jgi:hypothetical protein
LVSREWIVVPPILRARSARHGEAFCGLLVEKQVIIAKVPPADVPVKVLRLEIKPEHVGKQSNQVAR